MKKRINIFMIIILCVLVTYTLINFTMLSWTVLTSFKNERGAWEFTDYPIDLPKSFFLGNFEHVWKNFKYTATISRNVTYIEGMFGNSLMYAIGCATATTLVCSAVAYVTAMYKFKFSAVVYGIVIFTMSFPVIGNVASEMQVVKALGLKDHMWGMFILKANFIGGIYFMIFHACFSALPTSFSEAAKMDGASNITVMVRIYYPLVLNTLFTVWLLYFVTYWNDYQTLLLYCVEKPTIALGLYLFKNANTANIPEQITAALILFLPMLILFLIFRKRMLANLSMDSGVK